MMAANTYPIAQLIEINVICHYHGKIHNSDAL